MGDLAVDQGIAAEGPDFVLIFFIDFYLFELFFSDFNGVAFQKNVKDRALLAFYDPLH